MAIGLILKSQIARLPKSPGVYLFFNLKKDLIYVGKSVSIRDRVRSYFVKGSLGPKTDRLREEISNIKHIKVFSEFEALLLEAELIRSYQPFYNSQAKDDKSPLYIKISGSQIPLISTVRKQEESKSATLIGPFQSAKIARDILRMTRKIFPYCQHKNPKKPCLYVHLGLCPYPYKDSHTQHEYKKNIVKIKKLLKGESRLLTRQLTREMVGFSKAQMYEEAQASKAQLAKLQILLTTYHAPTEFLNTPTLVDDLSFKKLADLKEQLSLETVPQRIECYDISNILGLYATGAMVVFAQGQPDKDEYRRFKIKFTSIPNDYEMIKEVLARRFKNDWPKPDLIVIDGGRGQLNSALSILAKYKLKIPIISLAKRFEAIYTPDRVLPISLKKDNPARQLVQSIRDEAHRFAINYHRLLRSKSLLP